MCTLTVITISFIIYPEIHALSWKNGGRVFQGLWFDPEVGLLSVRSFTWSPSGHMGFFRVFLFRPSPKTCQCLDFYSKLRCEWLCGVLCWTGSSSCVEMACVFISQLQHDWNKLCIQADKVEQIKSKLKKTPDISYFTLSNFLLKLLEAVSGPDINLAIAHISLLLNNS